MEMKTIMLLALFAVVSAEPSGRAVLEKSPVLQNILNCRPDEKCSESIAEVKGKYYAILPGDGDTFKAVAEACPQCSFEQKFMMVSWLNEIEKGSSVAEANKLYNPNGKYFDTAVVN